ncbi:MAG: hypothetical protein AAFY88_31990, partial [Acidobacteriota bacterium]
MDQSRWQVVEQVFLAAVERRGSERDAYLKSACGDDEDLRREVERLLRHDDPRSQFVRHVVGEGARLVVEADTAKAGSPEPKWVVTEAGEKTIGKTLAG